jgi:phospholipase C
MGMSTLRAKLTGVALASVAVASAIAGAGPSVARVRLAPAAATPMCGTLTKAPTYKHVILIMEENHSYGTIYKSASAPYINSVMNACGFATNYHNITHPSLPNYIALTDGASIAELSPFHGDCSPSPSCQSTSDNIFNQADSKAGWKSYEESMPSPCDKSGSGTYAPRHNPAVYYTDLNDCASRDLPLGTTSSSPLLTNFSSEATAPSFAVVTPNICDDMHGASGCPSNSILTGDNWLKLWLPLITSTAVYKAHDTAVLITWDEGEGGSSNTCPTNTTDVGCHVAAIVVAPSVKPGTQVGTLRSHYSLLKTEEEMLGLPEVDRAQLATSMLSAFNL